MSRPVVENHDGALNPHTNKQLKAVFALYAVSVFIPAAITLYIMRRRGRNFNKWKWVPIVIYAFPFLMIAFYYLYVIFKDYLLHLKIPKLEAGELTNMRYDKKFPLWLYYDPYGRRHKFTVRDAASLINYLQKGDIILRRHENYLDSLILTQASYFTHAGIVTGFNSRGLPIIVHAIGKTGVDHAKYYDFMRCDDVAVIRLRENVDKTQVEGVNRTMLPGKLIGSHRKQEGMMTTVKDGDEHLKKVIVAEEPLIERTTSPRIGERQLKLFNDLQCKTCYALSDCIDVVTDMFKVYYKTPTIIYSTSEITKL
jgi:hypothetical protein